MSTVLGGSSRYSMMRRLRIHGKGGSGRTVLLDDGGYVALLRLFLGHAWLRRRAAVSRQDQRVRRAVVLRCRAPPVNGVLYCGRARYRHPPAAPRSWHRTDQLGVSIEAVRRRLGHARTQSTLLYALLEIRSPTSRCAPPAAAGTIRRTDRLQGWSARRSAQPSSRGPRKELGGGCPC